MWKASLLLAAVRADFDDAMVAAGQRGQRRAHKAGPALLDVLRVPVRTGCALTYAAGNRTLTFRGARRISFDPRRLVCDVRRTLDREDVQSVQSVRFASPS